MLNDDGGVIDDLITYYLGPDRYRVVVNAATRDKDLAWINAQARRLMLMSMSAPACNDRGSGPEARERRRHVSLTSGGKPHWR